MDATPTAELTSTPGQHVVEPLQDGGGGDGTSRRPHPLIGIHLCGSTALVWRTADVKAAREAGVVGSLVGALPRQPRQNGRLGRPLQLGQEELRLLLQKQASGDDLESSAPNSDGEVQQAQTECYEEEQRSSFEAQSILALEERKSALLRAMGGAKQGGGTSQPDGGVSGRLEVLDQSFVFPRSAVAVQLRTARAGLSHCSDERTLLSAAQPGSSQRAPRSESRFQVFRDLRQRGYYITSAGKFGGDFLVYPGDPLRFHAHFIAVCVALDEQLPLVDVLAVARLGSNVKKTVLLCSPGGPAAPVHYTSLQWSGMV
ncbi:tRNA-splicing endonuclease subunit Sen34 [Gadus morhua]|uniref:tRNA-splicing endonuclease subunit Sen34 n=1 Tax=Gadus morhua TaxID=8049 RepID=UPI0011B6267F|nr:tRNA-splicing endonuclease subunit Sen34 [Gadus morhua]